MAGSSRKALKGRHHSKALAPGVALTTGAQGAPFGGPLSPRASASRKLAPRAPSGGASSLTVRPKSSPLLSNLDELDRELERRGLTFVRYADDCNIYASRKAAERAKRAEAPGGYADRSCERRAWRAEEPR
jgi:hypothetical protein